MNSRPNKILLIVTRQIGDVLLTTPLLRSLRKAWPDAVIDVLVFANKGGVLEGNPDLNKVIECEERPNIASTLTLIKQLFRKYDLAISTQGSDRSHLYAFFASKWRVSMVPDLKRQSAWKRMINTSWKLLDDVNTHTVVQNLALAECLHIDKHYAVVPPQNAQSESALNQLLNFDWKNNPFVVIHLFPMWRYKRWTDAGWKSLLDHLGKNGIRAILTGGGAKEERQYCEQLALLFPNHVTSLAGKTSFAELSKLLKHARAYVGPDTATTHLAAACATPTLALFGPTNPVKWAPWPIGYCEEKSPWQRYSAQDQLVNNVLLLQGRGECVPCHQEGCDRHKNSSSRCLDELPAERVIKALDELRRS